MQENSMLPRLIVASNNKNKLKEFDAILGGLYHVVSMRDAGIDADIEEDGTTFEENAQKSYRPPRYPHQCPRRGGRYDF